MGNGGGYAYGVMGPSHHAIEDYGVLLTLPNMRVYAPVFNEDISAVVNCLSSELRPSYLRLGRGEAPDGYVIPQYAAWRQLTYGDGIVIIAVGPLASTYIGAFEKLPKTQRPNLWAVAQMPISANPLPSELLSQISSAPALCVAEEHVKRGGFASELALYLAEGGKMPKQFRHHYALAHTYGTYGSQQFLRSLSALDEGTLLSTIAEFAPTSV